MREGFIVCRTSAMEVLRVVFAVVFLSLVLASQGHSGEVVSCYYGSWAAYRPLPHKFEAEDIDPTLCTHLFYSFAGLDNTTWTIKVLDPYLDLCDNGGKCMYDRFTNLKKKNPNLKTLLSIGGWTEGSVPYSNMVSDPAKRKSFVESTMKLLLAHNFDGLDMDWEYPANRGGAPEDKENFILLLSEFRKELDKYGMLMTAALGAGKWVIDSAYDVPGLVKYLDFLHLMTYDYHGGWESKTHMRAPLKRYYVDEQGLAMYLNVDFTVKYFLSLGAPKEKLVIGMIDAGSCWVLDDLSNHGMMANGKPTHGYYYSELCHAQIEEKGWKIVREAELCEPYSYNVDTLVWCGYDDPDSVYVKGRYSQNLGVGGIMLWAIDLDDFKGSCHGKTFPFVRAMKEAFTLPADDPSEYNHCTTPIF